MRPAEREAVETALRVMSKNNRKCTCGSGSPMNYEGPQRDCPVHGEKSGEDEYGKPDDFEDATARYRITLVAASLSFKYQPAGSKNQFEMSLDAAELDFLKRLSAASNEDRSTARNRILVHRRVRQGDIRDDRNFAADA